MDVVLACGPGGRALAASLASLLSTDLGRPTDGVDAPEGAHGDALTILAGTAEDITLCGLRFCPDLDALARIPALTDPNAESTDAASSHGVAAALTGWGALPAWFAPDDLDIARAVARSRWLAAGVTPSEIGLRLTPPRHGVRLVPTSDRPVESHVVVEHGEERVALHALEWASRETSGPGQGGAEGDREAASPVQVGAAGLTEATPAPGVLDAIRGATTVVLPLTNPVTGLGVVLGLPGVRDALRGTSARVVGVSPLLLPTRGDEEATLRTLDLRHTSSDVGSLFADVLDAYLVPEADVDGVRARLREVEVRPAPTDLAALARAALTASGSAR